MRAWPTFVILFCIALPAAAETARFALIVGNNSGHVDDVTLLYAERDAQRLFRTLRDIGGFEADRIALMLGESTDNVRRTLTSLNLRIGAARKAGKRALLFVYYSGHAANDGLHLGRSTLPLDELRSLVTRSPANYRVLILDSCRSGKLTRVKGGRLAPPFKITLEAKLPGEGTVFITSSSANEDSQESDRLKASFFSHFLISGLLGAADADGDGRVTLNEVYHFAYHNTLRASSKTFAGIQRPTYRYHVKGKGDLVLTDLSLNRQKRGQLRFPTAGHYLVFSGNTRGALIAELFVGKRPLLLSVLPGSYLVRKRESDHLREGTLRVASTGTTRVEVEAMTRIAYARLVRKGSTVKSLAHGPMIHYQYRGTILDGMPGMHQVALSYLVALRWLSVTPRVGYGQSSAHNEIVRSLTRELAFETLISRSFDVKRVSFHLGVHLGLSYLRQTFETSGDAPPLDSLAFTFGAEAGIGVDIGYGLWAQFGANLLTYVLKVQHLGGGHETRTPLTFRVGIGFGYQF